MTGYADAPAFKSGEVLGYLDGPSRRYARDLKKVKTAAELQGLLKKWPFLAADATEQAVNFADEDVAEMQRSRRFRTLEKVKSAVERFGFVLIPARMLALTELAIKFKVPEGAVYFRAWETGEHDRLMGVKP